MNRLSSVPATATWQWMKCPKPNRVRIAAALPQKEARTSGIRRDGFQPPGIGIAFRISTV